MTAPETIYAYEFETDDGGADYMSRTLWSDSQMKYLIGVQYTRTDLTISRDDPVLVQVMEALAFLEKQLDSHGFNESGPMRNAASGALAALRELTGEKE